MLLVPRFPLTQGSSSLIFNLHSEQILNKITQIQALGLLLTSFVTSGNTRKLSEPQWNELTRPHTAWASHNGASESRCDEVLVQGLPGQCGTWLY